MTNKNALILLNHIHKKKVKAIDQFRFGVIERIVNLGCELNREESKFIEEVYRYTNGGGAYVGRH